MVDQETTVWVLADVARLGPYFTLPVEPVEPAEPAEPAEPPVRNGPVWRRLPELDPLAVRAVIGDHARRLGTGEQRVAASILFQGLAARLWSPVVAAAAVHGVVPDLSGLRWRWSPGTPVELWLADPRGWEVGRGGSAGGIPMAQDPAEPVRRTVLDGQLRPLVEAVCGVVGVAEGLLWGNAASALAGILYVRTERPELAGPFGGLVRRLLALEPLTGTGVLHPDGSFVRRSCCLYYRVPPGGAKCGDCVLLHPPKIFSAGMSEF